MNDRSGEEGAGSSVGTSGSLRSKRELLVEMAAVVCLAILADFIWALILLYERPAPLAPIADHVGLLVRSVQVIVPTLYIISRSGDLWTSFGVRRLRPLQDVPYALGAIALVVLVDGFIFALWGMPRYAAGAQSIYMGTMPSSGLGKSIFALAIVANSFAEELICRAYLITRLEQLTGSNVFALVTSSLLFASYHIYQGPIGIQCAFATGLVFGMVFLRSRRIWIPILAHTILNFYLYSLPR